MLFPETDTRAVPAAFAAILALNVALLHADSCTETPVTAQIHLCFLGFAHLFANATCSCSAVPPSCKTIYLFIFNPHQKPRNLYQLTQLLALVGEAQIQQRTGQIPSAGRYCAVIYFGSTDAIYSRVGGSGVTDSQGRELGLVCKRKTSLGL